MSPFSVASDDNVSVTATLVSHYDVYPAFGFRFDLKKSGVSVTFSGDTTKSDNLITPLKALTFWSTRRCSASIRLTLATLSPELSGELTHLRRAGGEVAAAAKPKQLILSHYAPDDLPDSQWLDKIKKNYSGMTTIARDGQVFAL